jgi:RimJ/RimL family protein N-acetyltransferase
MAGAGEGVSNMKVEIRAVTPDDAEGFHHVFDVVARERKYLSAYQASSAENTRKAILEGIKNKSPLFVAIDAGRVVGWCEVERSGYPMHAHVGDLAMGLLPEYCGSGYGLALLERAMQEAFATGIKRIALGVFADNSRARALYLKVGFIEEGVLRDATCIDGKFGDLIMMAMVRRQAE